MASHGCEKKVSSQYGLPGSNRNSFEERESNEAARQSSDLGEDDAELTELAVPPPPANDDTRDTYEEEEGKVKRTSSSLKAQVDLRSSSPVEIDGYSKPPTSGCTNGRAGRSGIIPLITIV